MRRIEIDLNHRSGALVPARYRGVPPRVGEPVLAYEPEDEVAADATVSRVDVGRTVVYLDIDWASLRDDALPPPPSPEEFVSTVRRLASAPRPGQLLAGGLEMVSR